MFDFSFMLGFDLIFDCVDCVLLDGFGFTVKVWFLLIVFVFVCLFTCGLLVGLVGYCWCEVGV